MVVVNSVRLESDEATALASRILEAATGTGPTDVAAIEPLMTIANAVRFGSKVRFVLSGFPAKSPDRRKTIGPDPDLAERIAIARLARLGRDIRTVYSPGTELVIASEGRATCDLLGVSDAEASAYRRGLEELLVEAGASGVKVFGLEDMFGYNAATARATLVDVFGASGSSDGRLGNEPRSRAGDQLGARTRAWARATAHRFPDAVRLFPYRAPGCAGVQLVDSRSATLTPWNGVAVDRGLGRFELMHRDEAERLGCSLAWAGGRPSHFFYAG